MLFHPPGMLFPLLLFYVLEALFSFKQHHLREVFSDNHGLKQVPISPIFCLSPLFNSSIVFTITCNYLLSVNFFGPFQQYNINHTEGRDHDGLAHCCMPSNWYSINAVNERQLFSSPIQLLPTPTLPFPSQNPSRAQTLCKSLRLSISGLSLVSYMSIITYLISFCQSYSKVLKSGTKFIVKVQSRASHPATWPEKRFLFPSPLLPFYPFPF